MKLKAWGPRFGQMLVGVAMAALLPAMARGGTPIQCIPSCTETECATMVCDTTIGQCVVNTNKDNSTPCGDTDGDACTTAGCEAGQCVQGHITTVCTPDNNECTDDPECNQATGMCAHPPMADSTPCGDTDANACTTAGCEAGECVQTHQTTICTPDSNQCTDDPACNPATGLCAHPPKANSTPCGDTDANACTDAGCEAGQCVQGHITTVCLPDNIQCTDDPPCNPATGLCVHPPSADSTPCGDTDANACTTAGCEAGQCVQIHQTTICTPDSNQCTLDPPCNPATGLCAHPSVPDSTPCGDIDNISCTTAGCEMGQCVQTHVVDINSCPATPTATATATATPTNTPVPIGGKCATSGQCQLGNCVDTVCCDTPCDDPLKQCNLPGHLGICTAAAAGVPATSMRGLIVAGLLLAGVAALSIARRRRVT